LNTEHQHRILLVDDNESIHEDYRKVLAGRSADESDLELTASLLFDEGQRPEPTSERFEIESARQGKDALKLVEAASQAGRPFSLAFVDVRMPPGWDGVETVRRIWEVDPEIQVVLCTAYSDRSWEDMVRILGRTDQFLILKKPFDNVEVRQLTVSLTQKWVLARKLKLHIDRLEDLIRERTQQVVATRDLSVFALAKLAESRDTETGQHLERMREYCRMLAEHLAVHGPYVNQIDQQYLDELYRSSPLHDIGKVGIPDAVLLKPGRLSDREFELMKQHTLIGAETLESVIDNSGEGRFLQMAAEIARHHHERFDGSGYPAGLVGEQIPLAARIVAVADVYDALTSVRVYKAAFNAEVARLMIEEQSGKHFDPAIVDAFRACFEQFVAFGENMGGEKTAQASGSKHAEVPVQAVRKQLSPVISCWPEPSNSIEPGGGVPCQLILK
jgi:response regulator RpfG family c-di-GMP phosphodiesterase